MGNCSGLHCPGCGSGGGPVIGAGAIVGLVVLAVVMANAHAIERTALEILQVAEITAASVAALAAVAASVAITVKIRRARSRRALARVNVPREIPPLTARVLPPSPARILPVGQTRQPGIYRRGPGSLPARTRSRRDGR